MLNFGIVFFNLNEDYAEEVCEQLALDLDYVYGAFQEEREVLTIICQAEEEDIRFMLESVQELAVGPVRFHMFVVETEEALRCASALHELGHTLFVFGVPVNDDYGAGAA